MARHLAWSAVLLCGVSCFSACTVNLSGARCATSDNCPRGQFCGVAGTCVTDGQPDPGLDGGGGGAGGSGGAGGGGGVVDCDGGLVDTARDPLNCGSCGSVCPAPLNAPATCEASRCSRGPCAAGFFDLDAQLTFGCESTCAGRDCTLPDGGHLTLSNDPLPETGFVWRAVSNGSSFGANVQTSAAHTNIAIIGDVTPGPDGGAQARSSNHIHVSGAGSRAH